MERLKVLYYDSFTTHDSIGVKRKLRFRSFNGYLKEEERNVRPAEHQEILELLKQCTNCRDQLLIMLLAETGYRIGEILGVDYTRDIDYERHTIRVFFRDDNENKARAKNAAYRRSKVSDATFQFLLFYLSKYREFLQHQQMLFVNIEGETKERHCRWTQFTGCWSGWRKDRHPYDAPYAAEILRKYEAGCWMAAGNDQ